MWHNGFSVNQLAIIIPALNEEQAIARVLSEIPAEYRGEVLVVDNGSTDGTARAAAEAGAKVVREAERGYGAACLRGIASLNRPGVVLFMDGDYSADPRDIPRLLKPLSQGEADLVLGARPAHSLSPQQRWGNGLATWLIRLFWGHAYRDLGPFRAIRYEALQALGMEDRNFGWTVEMQVKALQRRLRVCEVPVSERPRIGRSKVSGTARGVLLAGSKILYTILKLRLRSYL